MSDKRTVATDALDTLGTAPLDDTAKRDAIHLAVEPVIASERLIPGQTVTVRDGIAFPSDEEHCLGIVDPFLMRGALPGERFWFVMWPRTIKSLRHVWSHPAFPDEPGTHAAAAVPSEPNPMLDKAASERWLRDAIQLGDYPTYERLIWAAQNHDPGDMGLYVGDEESSSPISPEMWHHLQVVTGRDLGKCAEWFRCAC